jgi:predicted nucleotidyltransferase
MEVLKVIYAAASQAHKSFIVIGGHALNVHGISRSTADIDLMVETDDSSFWKALLQGLKYDVFHETASFIQSKPFELAAWPIDLMLVGKETMTKALADATLTDVFGPTVPVASVGSLIALKLHALKYVDAVRALKDQSDLLALLQQAGVPIESDLFRQLCAQYGTLEIYERIAKIAKQ